MIFAIAISFFFSDPPSTITLPLNQHLFLTLTLILANLIVNDHQMPSLTCPAVPLLAPQPPHHQCLIMAYCGCNTFPGRTPTFGYIWQRNWTTWTLLNQMQEHFSVHTNKRPPSLPEKTCQLHPSMSCTVRQCCHWSPSCPRFFPLHHHKPRHREKMQVVTKNSSIKLFI